MRPDVLELIVKKYTRHIVDLKLEQPIAEAASTDHLKQVQLDAREQLRAELDPAYIYLASLADGIGASGSTIFSTHRRSVTFVYADETRLWEYDWIIQENLDYRKFGVGSVIADSDPNNWLIYGVGEMAFIVQYLPSRRFQLRPRDNTDYAIRDVATFEEILWEVFRHSLDLGEFPTNRQLA
jgi:hypothetical protein